MHATNASGHCNITAAACGLQHACTQCQKSHPQPWKIHLDVCQRVMATQTSRHAHHTPWDAAVCTGQGAVFVLSANPGRVVTPTPNVGILLRLPTAPGNPPPSEHAELRNESTLPDGEGGSFSTGPALDLPPEKLPAAGASRPKTSTGSPPRCKNRLWAVQRCSKFQQSAC